MNDITLNLADLGWIALFAVIITAVIFLIVLLAKLIGTIGRVNMLISQYAGELDRIMKSAPTIIENVEDVSENVKETVHVAGNTVGLLGDVMVDTSLNILEKGEDLSKGMKTAGVVLKAVGSVLTGRVKRKEDLDPFDN